MAASSKCESFRRGAVMHRWHIVTVLFCESVTVFVRVLECYIESFQGAVMHRWHRDERDLDSSVDSPKTGTVLHCYSDTLLHCYNVTLLQCYNVTLLQCYNDTFFEF